MPPSKTLLSSVAFVVLLCAFATCQEETHEDSSSYCPLVSAGGSCSCEAFEGGHDLWCPSHLDQRYRLHYKAGVMWIVCKPQAGVTEQDLIFQMRNISVGDNRVNSLEIQNCPILSTSYADLVSSLGIAGLRELFIKDGATELLGGGYEPLQGNIFRGMESLLALNFRRGSFGGFHEDTFAGLGKLTTLFISGQGITSLPRKLFSPLTSLVSLDLLHSDVQEYPSNLFESQTQLERLTLDARALKKFPTGIFEQLGELKALFMSNIDFEKDEAIPPNLLSSLSELRNLTIQNSLGFEKVPSGFYDNLKKLEHFVWRIYPCKNQCNVSLDGRMVKGRRSLISFTFNIGIKTNLTLSEDFFEDCDKLADVSLIRSGLTSLPDRLFQSTPYLKKLDLSGSRLTELSPSVFKGLHRLEELNLNRNLLKHVPEDAFRDLANLKKLNLATNNIRTIEKDAFSSLVNLKDLNLDKNHLDFDDTTQPNWNSLKELKELILSNNNISLSQIPPEWRIITLRLERLILKNNNIGPRLDAAELDFHQSSELFVDLSSNNVQGVDFDTLIKLNQRFESSPFYPDEDGPRKPPKAKIMLRDNPFNCDCRMLTLVQMLNFMQPKGASGRHRPRFWFFKEEMVCARPEILRTRRVRSVALDELACQFPSDHIDQECPSKCQCFYSSYDNSTKVSCNDKGLETFPEFIPVVRESDKIILDLSDNNIGQLERLDDKVRYGNGSEDVNVILSGNEIAEVDFLPQVHSNLKSIMLDGNNIEVIRDDVLEFMSGLSSLALGMNLYRCGCETEKLYDFVRAHDDLVVDVDNVTVMGCGSRARFNESSVLANLQKSDLCPGVNVAAVVTVVAVVVILILVAVVLVLGFKETILMRIYSHKSLRYLFPGDPLEHDRIFDAFISYSNEDASFVEGVLVPELESSKNNLRYKCLVHVRDFKAGENIAKQIVEAVTNSRRTVIVLSRNFVRSEWYEEEFRAANANNKRGIIVVVYGELPTQQEMGPLMWQYIKSNTYLKQDDLWFWDKLRYALPHRGREAFKSKKGFPRWKANKTDQMQLIENGAIRQPPASNGVAVAPSATSNGHLSNGGQANASYIGSTYFVDNTPPGTAAGNGFATEVGS